MANDSNGIFLPYHYPAIFDRTFKAAENSQGVVCALLCATALEAFVHDVIGWYGFVKKNIISYGDGSYPKDNYLSPVEIIILDGLVSSEKSKGSVFDKFNCFSKWDESEQTYQDFKTLVNIRNSLAHIKPEELSKCDGDDFVNGYPKFLNNFFQKKIIEKPKNFVSWIEVIETQEFCLWCQNAAYKMVEKTIGLLPDTKAKITFSEKIRFRFDVDDCRKRLQEYGA